MIIGLGYKARSGKDTVATYLRQKHGFVHTWFAKPLKDAAEQLFGLTKEQTYGTLKEEADPFWGESPRVILQKFGTDCMRKNYREDFWIKCMQRQLEKWRPELENFVISDVRYTNEAEAIHAWGGVVWRVDRDESGALGEAAQHISEIALADWGGWDHCINNNGTYEDLWREIEDALADEKK